MCYTVSYIFCEDGCFAFYIFYRGIIHLFRTWLEIYYTCNFISFLFQMGGRSNVKDELLCRFIFPERPGALMKFLDALSPRWNISLFHYRGQVNRLYCHIHSCYNYLCLFINIVYIFYVTIVGRYRRKCSSWYSSCSNRDGRVSTSCKQYWL